MRKVTATHYVCIKDKSGKDKLILRAGETRELKEADYKLLQAEAAGRWVDVVDVKESGDE